MKPNAECTPRYFHHRAGTDVPAAGPGVRSDHAIALDFVRELRGTAATEAESALLQDACDACCEDTDVDTLLSVAGGR